MPYDARGYLLGDLAVPEGLRPFGWCSRPAQSMKDRDTGFSVMHLHDPSVELTERRLSPGTVVEEPWSGLCGRKFTGRWRAHVAGKDAQRYCTKHCERCLRAAVERVHVPTFRTRRTGVGNTYGRGSSGGGNRLTRVSCSCGWENRSNVTKGEQRVNFREHVRGVVDGGLWRVEVEGFPPRVVDADARAIAHRIGVDVARIEALTVGGRFVVGRSPGRNDAKAAIRLALPLRRMEEGR